MEEYGPCLMLYAASRGCKESRSASVGAVAFPQFDCRFEYVCSAMNVLGRLPCFGLEML